MSTDRPADHTPAAGDPLLLRPLPAGWVAPKIKEIPLLTLAGVLRHLHDTIETASSMADTIDYQLLESQAFELEEAKRRWESDHPGVPYGVSCSCPCSLWLHKGLCKEYAEMFLEVQGVKHYVCRPCRTATSTDRV